MSDEQYSEFKAHYDEHMNQFMEGVDQVFSEMSLKELEDQYTAEQDKMRNYEGSSEEAEAAKNNFFSNLKANAAKVLKEGKTRGLYKRVEHS